MNGAIGAGYIGLYEANTRRQTAKEEFDILQSVINDVKLEREKEAQADLQEQMYYESISKFAENLLEEDRNAINRKARQMASSVRQHIRDSGGSVKKFFENGGHRMLGTYKSSIINSDEASEYIENKKNLEKILELQQKGLGHLINPKDLYNLKERQKNGSGRITYSGMLNEVDISKMANDYAYGEYISPEDILNRNYMAILGNYKSIYTTAGEPTREDLLTYVKATFGNRTGTNININNAAFQQDMQIAEYKTKVSQFNSEMEFKSDAHNDSMRIQNEQLKLDWARFELQQAQWYATMYGLKGGEVDADGNVSYTDAEGNPVKVNPTDLKVGSDLLYQTAYVETDIQKREIKASEFSDATTEGYEALGLYDASKISSRDDEESGFELIGTDRRFTMAGAKIIASGQEVENLFKTNPNNIPFKVDENGIIKGSDLQKNSGIFSSNGIEMKNVAKPDRFFKNKTFKIESVVVGAEVTLGNGQKRIVMDETNKEGYVFNAEKNKQDKEKRYEGRNVSNTPAYIVLKDQQTGRILYQKLDTDAKNRFISSSGISKNQAKTKAVIDYERINKGKHKTKDIWKYTMSTTQDTYKTSREGINMKRQGQVIFGTNNRATYDKLMFAFYNSLEPKDISLQDLSAHINADTMTQFIDRNEDIQKYLEGVRKTTENGGYVPPRDIINKFISTGAVTKEMGQRWLNVYQSIQNEL